MSDNERDEFLSAERTCRVATVDADGSPHVTPLWFVWDGESLWLTSLTKSQRWQNLQGDGRIAIVVDGGNDFMELRGVELEGFAESVGEVPRTGESNMELEIPEQLFADKYAGGRIVYDGRHAWLRIRPEKIVSWDFRKMKSADPT